MLNRYLGVALVAGCVFVATLGAGAARADEASHRKAAEDVLIASDSDKNYEKSFLIGFNAQMKHLPPEVQKVGLDFSKKYMSWDSVKGDIVKLYIDHFTEEELKEIKAFYRSPVGKKTVTLMPALMAMGMETVQRRIDEHKSELMAAMALAKEDVLKREALEKQEKEKAGTPPKAAP
ncbi:MAG: DUF2059 domain-containing protein [Alphaproteobacteria bacterium]